MIFSNIDLFSNKLPVDISVANDI